MGIVSYLQSVNDIIWTDTFWLPNNMTWAILSPPSNETFLYSSVSDLDVPFKLAIVLLAVRFGLERFCFRPLALSLKVRCTKPKPPVPNDVLEKVYSGRGRIPHDQIVGLSKQLDWTERQIDRWLRVRRAQDKPTTLVKFTETCWRFVFYTSSFFIGAYSLWDKPWATDTTLLVVEPPHHITTDCWWYCMISCGFYWSALITICFDVKRRDFLEMLLHHCVALLLVNFCWITNGHRFMCLGFFMYDFSDIFVELAKLAKYAQYFKLSSVLFGVLVFVWAGTRLVWYPFHILRITFFVYFDFYPFCKLYVVGNFLLSAVFVLNMFWTYMIFKTCIRGIVHGAGNTRDARSSGDEVSDSSEST